MLQPSPDTTIKAYWQPGCTSCLRMKEFLTRHGVPFVSVNVLEDQEGFAELAALGLRTVPIVRRGTDWANGQVLRDVARVAGIPWGGASMLPVPEMCDRLVEIQTTAQRLFAQIPDAGPGTLPLKEGAYARVPAPGSDGKAAILAYGADVLRRFEAWRAGPGRTADFTRKARVYYGDVTLHDYLERTTWHSGQHVRQLVMVLGLLGIAPDRPPTAAAF